MLNKRTAPSAASGPVEGAASFIASSVGTSAADCARPKPKRTANISHLPCTVPTRTRSSPESNVPRAHTPSARILAITLCAGQIPSMYPSVTQNWAQPMSPPSQASGERERYSESMGCTTPNAMQPITLAPPARNSRGVMSPKMFSPPPSSPPPSSPPPSPSPSDPKMIISPSLPAPTWKSRGDALAPTVNSGHCCCCCCCRC
mmetsp:Transcript_23345/g.37410  ORF Transcript_23345/g.37410 Transcript_23345/m.37410 type:complete len:203 (-) Transcript_23345:1-609(-)